MEQIIKELKLTPAEIMHLLRLVHTNEEEGTYYGNPKHYWKRSDNIKNKIIAYATELNKKGATNGKDN